MAEDETPTANNPEPDYYAIIGVSPGATPEEIRRTYGEKIRDAQSDRERFQALSSAYEMLKDTAKRAAYDRRRALAPPGVKEQERTGIRMGNTEPAAPAANVRTAVMGAATAMGSPPSSAGGYTLPTVCAMDVTPCPLLTRGQAPDEGFCPECGFMLGSTLGESIRPRPLPRLVDMQGREFPLKLGENIVGREGADVMLPHNTVSRRHARIVIEESGTVSLEDTGSTNGTRVSGTMLPKHQRTGLRDRMLVQFGAIRLTIFIPEPEEELLALPENDTEEEPALQAIEAPSGGGAARLVGVSGETHTLIAARTTFGRRSTNNVVLHEDSYVSGNHAEITFEEGGFILIDLGSTNGTSVNGRRLSANTPQPLKNGDKVIMGQTEFTFYAPS